MKLSIFKPDTTSETTIPFVLAPVQAGFLSPADDHIEQKLDLNALVIEHPSATFFVRVEGESMKNAHIQNGDILVVDRSVSPKSGKIVVAILNGEFTLKRIHVEDSALYLVPENPDFKPLKVEEEMDFQIWGVVTYVIHKT